MKIEKKFGNRIYIEWVDAMEKTGWRNFSSATAEDEEARCFTNGFFLKEDKNHIWICHTVGKSIDDDVLGVLIIPKGWIIKWR